jgi:dipeptidyl aminopeptidase/acylaminoacyl peptidase
MTSVPLNVLFPLLFCIVLVGQEQKVWKIAFIKDSQIYSVDSLNRIPQRLTNDDFAKYMPSWSPDGKLIAYLRDNVANIALPVLIVIDQHGKELQRAAPYEGQIVGGTSQVVVPRSLAIVGWVDDQRLVIEGTLNRWVCEYRLVDIRSTDSPYLESGECGTFQMSPDGKHSLIESNLRANAEDDWRDGLDIDGIHRDPQKVGYRDIRFATKPVWSPDSARIAVVERHLGNGQKSLVIVNLSGDRLEARLPEMSDDLSDPEWIGGEVLISDGGHPPMVFGPDSSLRAAKAEMITTAMKRSEQNREQLAERNAAAKELVPDIITRPGAYSPNYVWTNSQSPDLH